MVTYANQKIITIQLPEVERNSKRPYLIIYRDILERACRDLKTSAAITVYLYLASNQNSFTFGFSPKAVSEAYGISEDSARNGFNKLVEKNYLVKTGKTHYDFFPQAKPKISATTPEPKKHFKDEDSGETICLSYRELLEIVGDKKEADILWIAQED